MRAWRVATASAAALTSTRLQSSTTDASPSASSGGGGGGGGDLSHITYTVVWGLWNEGNLFSLSTPELQFFLREHCKVPLINSAAATKKSALVRQIEEILAAEQAQQQLTVPQTDTAHTVVVTDYDRVEEGLDEADEYGDWGAEPGFEQRRNVDYMEITPTRMGERYDILVPRSFQLLHSDVTSDLQLTRVDPSRLPGQRAVKQAYTVSRVETDVANRQRFRRAFEWCLLNTWNMNMPGELNIGAGKALYYRQVAKQNRNVLPLWSLQRHLYGQHPYVWFAIASQSNVAAMERLAEGMGLKLIQDATTSYKVAIRRMGEPLDCELNAQLQCVKLNRPWDRLLVTHYIRSRMPDLRYVVRGRHPVKKRVADAYLETDILRSTRDSVQSVLSPELGDVTYCCERVIRKWATRTPSGVVLQLVETKRTPLIISRIGDEGERLEYEWIVPLPQKAEKVDIAVLSDEVWAYGNTLAAELEAGMEEFMAHTMTAAASYS